MAARHGGHARGADQARPGAGASRQPASVAATWADRAPPGLVRVLRREIATRPALALSLWGLASLGGYLLLGGMSERLRTTWHLANVWDHAISATMPGAGVFRVAVGWVPVRVPAPLPGSGSPASPFLMAMAGYVLAAALLFALYALALRWIARHPASAVPRPRVLVTIGAAGALFGAILLFSPSAASHDPIAYGTSGRLLTIYHANPFFVLPSAYPFDPLLAANEWPHSATAYGPLWNVLSAVLAPLVGDDPLRSNLVYRVVAYLFQLANIALLIALVRQLPARQRAWQERGLLLYAWNPLVVIEVAGGHNDVAMLTCLLLGLYLAARGRRGPALICYGAAILIKSSAWPLVLVILLGAWVKDRGVDRAVRSRARMSSSAPRAGRWQTWLGAPPLRDAALLGGVVLAGYLPFFWGHSRQEIAQAANSQPTNQTLARYLASSFSTLAGQVASWRWLPTAVATQLARGALALSNPPLWTVVVGLLLLATTFLLLPALRRSTALPVALAWVYAVWLIFISIFHLLRTWYIVPLVVLVALAPGGRAIRRFTLVLTATIQLENLFLSRSPPFDGWQPWTWFLVMGIPLAILIVDLRREGFDWRAQISRSTRLLRALLPLDVAASRLPRAHAATKR